MRKNIFILIILLSIIFPLSAFGYGEGRIQRMSITYSGRIDNAGVKEYLKSHFDLVDTEMSSAGNSIITWIKSYNPNFKAIGYYESIFSIESASNWSEINPNNGWFMHVAANGNRVERHSSTGYLGQYLMNPNSGWNNYMTTRCQSALNNYPMYDGIFLDDYAGDIESTAYGPYYFMDAITHATISLPYQGKINESYTRTNWGTWMTAYITNLRNTLGSHMIMTNSHIDTYLGNIAGTMLWEGFIHSRSSSYSSNGYSPSNIFLAVDKLHEQALQGKTIAVNSGCSGGTASQKEEWAKFCYAALSFAIEDSTKAYFSWEFMPENPTTGTPTWYSFMDTNLGNPTSNYYNIKGYVYARDFANYYVIANLYNLGSSTAFTFNGANYNLEGKHALFIQKATSTLSVSFVPPTPANGAVITQNQTTIAASVSPTTTQLSSFINWNQSLVGYWSLNEGTGLSALDLSTYGNNATLKNGVAWTTGKFGKALNFDGVNDYVSVSDSNSLDLTNALTIEAWVYPTVLSSYPRIISKESGNYAYPYALEVSSNKVVLYVKLQGSSSNEQLAAQANTNLSLNTWTHVVVTWNGQVGKVYYNGVKKSSDTSLSGTLIQTTKPLLIGNSPNIDRPWKGKIDEVRIWKRVLSEQEIKASYNTSLYNLSNTFTNLPNGTYQYYARTINTAGTTSQTETRTLTVNKIAMIDNSQMLANMLDAILKIQAQIDQLKELIIK